MVTMLNTKLLNQFLGTTYTLDEVAGMDWLLFDMLATFRQAMNPPKKGDV